MQNAKAENSIPESKEREECEEESENEDVQRHVEFSIAEDASNEDIYDSNKPNKLQRRDTPHHLKNKRIHTAIDKDKVASIIAQVNVLCFLISKKKILHLFATQIYLFAT